MPILEILQGFNLNKAMHTASVVIIVTLATALYKSHVELAEAKVVYTHPNVVTKVNTIRVEGPVRIVTKVVEMPSGEKDTTITEDRAPVTEKVDASSTTTIVPISVAIAPLRSDRYLLGLGLLDFSPRLASSYRLYAGYSFKNRVDLFYGAGWDDGYKQSVNVILRF